MLSRPLLRLLVAVTLVVVLCSGCWVDLATKSYPSDAPVIRRVEQWRPEVEAALEAQGLDVDYHTPIALITMACESKGIVDVEGGGLYQFTTVTWAVTSQSHLRREDPVANIAAMAERVAKRGWRDWAGGELPDGSLWGSGPKGHRCWQYPR